MYAQACCLHARVKLKLSGTICICSIYTAFNWFVDGRTSTCFIVIFTVLSLQCGLLLLDAICDRIWKTDHLDTRTEIHLLPVRDRHIHALSRNTKQ